MIRLAKILEIPDILIITQTCAKNMIDHGIYQWNEYYPSKEAFEKDIARKELYVLEKNDEIIGTIVVSTLMDGEYIPINWLTPNKNNIYIHRLAVHPITTKEGLCPGFNGFCRGLCPKKRLYFRKA